MEGGRRRRRTAIPTTRRRRSRNGRPPQCPQRRPKAAFAALGRSLCLRLVPGWRLADAGLQRTATVAATASKSMQGGGGGSGSGSQSTLTKASGGSSSTGTTPPRPEISHPKRSFLLKQSGGAGSEAGKGGGGFGGGRVWVRAGLDDIECGEQRGSSPLGLPCAHPWGASGSGVGARAVCKCVRAWPATLEDNSRCCVQLPSRGSTG